MQNVNIRSYAKSRGVYLWQVACELGITDATLSRKLRKELPQAEKEQVLEIIDRLAQEKQGVM